MEVNDKESSCSLQGCSRPALCRPRAKQKNKICVRQLTDCLEFAAGSPPMSAPSSVETSTSTGSGDWSNRRGVVVQPRPLCCWSPPRPPPPPRRGSGRAPNSGWTVRDHPPTHTRKRKRIKNSWRREREPGCSSYLLESSCFFLFYFFPPKHIKEPLCLTAPDTDWVSGEFSHRLEAF